MDAQPEAGTTVQPLQTAVDASVGCRREPARDFCRIRVAGAETADVLGL
jgi:hypothetical protein